MINFGGDAVAGAREIFNFGLTPRLPLIMSWSSGVEELVQLAPEIRDNLWVGTNFYYTADTPVAKSFRQELPGQVQAAAGLRAFAAYSMTRMLLAGFDKSKSDDVQAVVKALEGLEMNDIVGPMRVDGATHRRCALLFLRCEAEGRDEARTGFRGRRRHRGRAAAERIRRLQGHRKRLSLPL